MCLNCGLKHYSRAAKLACSLWNLTLANQHTHAVVARAWAALVEEVRMDAASMQRR